MCSFHTDRNLLSMSFPILFCLSLFLASCNSGEWCAQGYPGPRRSAQETSRVECWITTQSEYGQSVTDKIRIWTVDGGRGYGKEVCVLPGERDFELRTEHHWEEGTSMERTEDSSTDDRSYRVLPSYGISSWPLYCERRWLVTLNVELGVLYRFVRGAVDEPPAVYGYRPTPSGLEAVTITASVRPYYYSEDKRKWYLE